MTRSYHTIVKALIILVSSSALVAGAEPIRFEKAVQPIFQRHCTRCHGGETRKAELSLVDEAQLLKGSESGPVLDLDVPERSRLLKLVTSGEMPPEDEPRLTTDELAVIRSWVLEGSAVYAARRPAKPWSQHDILPLLYLRCATCHGRQKQEGGFDIRTRASLLAGGKSGPGFIPGNPDESRLVQRIAAGEMPPKTQLAAVSVKPVEDLELAKIRDWITNGAPEIDLLPDEPDGTPDPLVSDVDREFWSFQPPRPVAVPPLPASRSHNPLDQFVQEKLFARGLTFSPPADRLVLLRRISFDLLGLPPTSDQIARFVQSNAETAALTEQLVDELLASPAYGERWGQYWLDLAGYSDSEGVQDSDLVRPFAFRYRDYVIRAWNSDKPYDRFVLEQLAGDELADYESAAEITPEIYDNLVATGFLRMSPDGTFSGITGFVPNRLDVVDDQLKNVSAAFLGLTVGCARCHSHKFDPLPQRDYYRLAAIFKGALDEHDWLKPTRQAGTPGIQDRYLPYVTTAERSAWDAHEKSLLEQIAPLKNQLEQAKDDAETKKTLEQQIKALESQRKPQPLVRALWDRGEPSPTYLLSRGDYLRPTRLVGPGFPSILTAGHEVWRAEVPWPGSQKTGRRLAFARWLVEPTQPLTARVAVNRIWKHHFGQGIVATLDNFGRAGESPSHPELLDWLSTEWVRHGWSIKWLQRLIVNSATYQQSSRLTETIATADPENRWLSRMPIRRLDAEALRDTLHAVADRLDRRQFGPGDAVDARPDGLVTSALPQGNSRRSIYVLHRRSQPLSILADFDRPAMSPNCTARVESNVAPQALHLLNSRLVHDLSEAVAERVSRDSGGDRRAQIEQLYHLALARSPEADEIGSALAGIERLEAEWSTVLPSREGGNLQEAGRRALANYCHAILNSAALLYIE